MIQRKLIMRFITEVDHLGNEKYKKVTLNVRPDLTDNQLNELVEMYCEMTANQLVEAVVTDSRVLVEDNEFFFPGGRGGEEEIVEEVAIDEEQPSTMAEIKEIEGITDKEEATLVEVIPDVGEVNEVEENQDQEEDKVVEIIPDKAETKFIEVASDKVEAQFLEVIPDKKETGEVEKIPNQMNPELIVGLPKRIEMGWSKLWVSKTVSFLDDIFASKYLKKNKKGRIGSRDLLLIPK